jgi:DNA helicase-2/ATP-dependent DNA helicase PcrA
VKFGGLKFLDTAHVKDLLALLRFIESPRDRIAGFRVMQLLPGVGPAAAHHVLDRMTERADRLQGDRHVYAPRTRFVPATLLPLLECTIWPIAVAAVSDRANPRQVRLDVGARLRSMWR